MKTRAKRPMPFDFVLDQLAAVSPEVRPLFGFFAVYVGDKMVFCLRHKDTFPEDNGVWIATRREHHASLLRELPSMRSLVEFPEPVTDTQVIPMDAEDFESQVVRVCELVVEGDERIGRVPKRK